MSDTLLCAARGARLSAAAIFLVALSALLPSGSANATAVLDASYTPAQSIYGLSVWGDSVAQTFTVQSTGFLTGVNVTVESVNGTNQVTNGGLTLYIVGLNGGTPDFGNVFASATLPYSSFPVEGAGGYSPTSFGISPFQVTSGEQLAVVLAETADTVGAYGWNGDLGACCGPNGTYAGGATYYALPNGYNGSQPLFTSWTAWNSGLGDLSFQTFVDPNSGPPVPEPATWATMLLGFCGIGLAMRRNGKGAAPKALQRVPLNLAVAGQIGA